MPLHYASGFIECLFNTLTKAAMKY